MKKEIRTVFIFTPLFWAMSISLYADQTKPDYNQLLAAPTELTISGELISFDSYVYLNLMPQVIDTHNKVIDCKTQGRFIVQILLNRSSLLRETSIANVWVHSSGQWWSGTFDSNNISSYIRNERKNLKMVARGCPLKNFHLGASVDVVVELKHKQVSKYFRSPTTKLGAAH